MDDATEKRTTSSHPPEDTVQTAGVSGFSNGAEATADFQTTKVGNTTVTLPKRYKATKLLGSGRCSVSVLANDAVTKKTVSIRKYKQAFEDAHDTLSTLSELHVRRLLKHDNVSE